MSVKFLEKRVIPTLAILILIASYILLFVMRYNPKTIVLPEDEFEVTAYTFSQGETMWDFWKENIGSENCSWSNYCEAVSELNGNISLGDIKANQTIYVYYLIKSEVN